MTNTPEPNLPVAEALADWLRRTTEEMANKCSVSMDIWNEHSNACLSAADELDRLTATPIPDTSAGERATEIVRLIEELRKDEGDSVTILCDNPDFNGQPNSAVICNGDWTSYEDRRFAADTILDALCTAVTERKLPAARRVIAESNGHHWVERFNLVCCRDCGIVRRADDNNKPCKGVVTVELRAPSSPGERMREALVEAEDLLAFHEGSAEPAIEGGHPVVWVNNEDLERVLKSLRAAIDLQGPSGKTPGAVNE